MQALRLFLVAAALRFDVSFAQATALVIAAVSAAAIGFLPAGLGAREAIAAILSPIVGFPAAVGLVITAVDRVVNLVVLSVFAGIVTLATRRERAQAQSAGRQLELPVTRPELERLAAEAEAAQAAARVEHEPGVVDDVVVRQLGVVDEQHDEVGGCELLDACSRRAVIGGPSGGVGGHVRVVRAHVGAELRAAARRSSSTATRASRSCRPCTRGRAAGCACRSPTRCCVVQQRDDARDDVVGHAAVHVVGELDEAEPLAELPLDAPREIRRVDRQAVAADARARA